MKSALLGLIALLSIVGCGSSSEPEPTKDSFAAQPKPEGFGPTAAPSTGPPTGK